MPAVSRVPRSLTANCILLIAVAVSLSLAGCAALTGGGGGGGGAGAQPGIGEPAPDISMDEFWSRKEIRISALRGKIVLLDIWASWCVPCKEELPVLDDLARRFKGQNVEVIAVSIDEERATAEQFLKRRKQWSLTLAHDPSGVIPDRLQPPKMPTSYLIDRQGILRNVNAGYERGDAAKLESQLRDLVAGH